MSPAPCLLIYGNSIFLAGIRAELEGDPGPGLELVTVETNCVHAADLVREHKPCAVLVNLGMDQPSFVLPMLRKQHLALMIGVDPSSDELPVLTVHPVRALAVQDAIRLVLEASQLQERNSKGKQTGHSSVAR